MGKVLLSAATCLTSAYRDCTNWTGQNHNDEKNVDLNLQ